MDPRAVRQAVLAGQDLSQLHDAVGSSLLDCMISCPSSHLLKEDWSQFLETVKILAASGAGCHVRMHMLLGFWDELSPRLSLDKLQIALHAGLREKFKWEALQQFQHEGRGPFAASLDTCLLRRVIREFPQEQLLPPAKLQCLEVVKHLLGANTRIAVHKVRQEINVTWLSSGWRNE